jgi:uncharacterized membrane protein
MIPLIVLAAAFLIFRATGWLGVAVFADNIVCLRWALAIMFLLTASAHWGKRRPDLIRMVPPAFPAPHALVTITGVLEILGAIGLTYHSTAHAAAVCLAILLLMLFPANAYAARQKLTIGGRRVPPLFLRLVIQLVFLQCLIIVALHA